MNNETPPRHVPLSDELSERVRAAVARVPAGSVATYGDIAALTGAPSARLVGRVLAQDGHDVPWHRILRADGTAAPHLRTEQLRLLREEGVTIHGHRVDLRLHRWVEAVGDRTAEGGLW